MFLIKEKPLGFRNKRILIIWFSLALFLFSELVLPLHSAFSSTFYDDDIENECCELFQNSHANNINKKDEDEVEEIDDDSFFYSSLRKNQKNMILKIIK
jgi:hypothetical protein